MTAHVAGLTEQELEVARSDEFDLVLSGYFFLREWLDHGHPSHGLHKLGEEKEAIEAERRATLESVSDAVSEFHDWSSPAT